MTRKQGQESEFSSGGHVETVVKKDTTDDMWQRAIFGFVWGLAVAALLWHSARKQLRETGTFDPTVLLLFPFTFGIAFWLSGKQKITVNKTVVRDCQCMGQ